MSDPMVKAARLWPGATIIPSKPLASQIFPKRLELAIAAFALPV